MVEVVPQSPYPLFRLADLPTSLPSKSTLPRLPSLDARFSLPHLDEHASGTERLLAGISDRSNYKALLGGHKGESHDEAIGIIAEEEASVPAEDLWGRAVENAEAGPSRPRTFEAS